MDKKIATLFVAALILSVSLFGFGCGQKTVTQPEEKADTLEELFSRAGDISQMSYDMYVTDTKGDLIVSKVYIQGTKMRTESEIQGEKAVMLGDTAGDLYTYYPEKNSAIKISMAADEEVEVEKTPVEMLGEVIDSLTVIGTETVDGKKCTVVLYTIADTNYSQKMWVWEKYGMPIKVETTTAEGTMTIEYKNIDFGKIPDSQFELPAGVQVLDLESMMQGNFDPSLLESFGQ